MLDPIGFKAYFHHAVRHLQRLVGQNKPEFVARTGSLEPRSPRGVLNLGLDDLESDKSLKIIKQLLERLF